LLVRSFLGTRRFEDAVDVFTALAEERPEVRAAALAARAGFLDRLSEWEDAERDLAEAARIDPQAATFAALGALRLRMERSAAALAAYDLALAAAPGDVDIRYLHARALWLTGRAHDAEREIDALLAADPGFGAAWAVKGRLRDAASDGPGAKSAFEAALRFDPDNIEARFMLARRAIAGADLDQAKRWLAEIGALESPGDRSRRGAGEILP
jgi:tetratricopeptide (TPR) repeat protein